MVIRKLPQLRAMPVEESIGPGFLDQITKTISKNRFVKRLSMTKVLERVLSRTEEQTNVWLKKLKQRSVPSASYSDNYWQELKKSTHLAESIPIEEGAGESEKSEEVEIKVTKRSARRKAVKPR